MTTHVALFLSSEGIALAHRQGAGHWTFLGDTSFDAPDLDAAMADLRALAEAREGKDFATLLILPDDQLLYTSLTAPTNDPEMTESRIEEGLEGLTPYAVPDLVYDWRAISADRVKLAVVARETLDEARAFALAHGFTAAGFAAMPPQERFPGTPLFDLSPEAHGLSFPEEGIAFGPDTWAEEKQEEADREAAEAAREAEEKGKAEPAEAASDTPGDAPAGGDAKAATEQKDETAKAPDDAPAASESGTENDDAAAPDAAAERAQDAAEATKAEDAAKKAQQAKAPETETPDAQPSESVAEAGAGPTQHEATEAAAPAGEPPPAEETTPAGPVKEAAETSSGEDAARAKADEAEKASGPDEPARTDEEEAAELDPEEAIAAASARGDGPLHPGAALAEDVSGDADLPSGKAEDEGDETAAQTHLEDPALTGPIEPLDSGDAAEAEADELPPAPSSAVLAARKASASFAGGSGQPGFSARRDPVPAREDQSDGEEPAPPPSSRTEDAPAPGEREEPSATAARNPLAERLSRVREASRTPPHGSADAASRAERALRPAPRREDA
ncbi:hypothetical protein P6F26_06905, partial [Roseibacterium sp. SDUM158017]|nr:hypothetical protein [Roseibacterium sp. SDUM158017]